MKKILIVDDESVIADAIGFALTKEGYDVETAYDGLTGVKKAKEFKPDIIILDVMMPIMDGFEVIGSIENRNNMGIIMLTARGGIEDRIKGLEMGADDYITKPFDIREIIARVNSLYRRLGNEDAKEITIGDMTLKKESHQLIVGGQSVAITAKEMELLWMLLSHKDRIFKRDELLEQIWGYDYFGGSRTVDIHIQRIRKKIPQEVSDRIITIYGVGYKFT